jgi:uncharacterized membrane protein YuzA (DUF378 family)
MKTAAPPSASTLAFRKVIYFIAFLGAIDWGLIGLFDWNLVDAVLGGGAVEQTSTASRVVYAIIGLAGLAGLLLLPNPGFVADNVRPDL